MVAAAFLLLYYCFSAALLLLYCCFTAVLQAELDDNACITVAEFLINILNTDVC